MAVPVSRAWLRKHRPDFLPLAEPVPPKGRRAPRVLVPYEPLGRWTVEVPGWRPVLDNQLVYAHWMKRSSIKKADVRIVGAAALAFGVPAAFTRRRVSVAIAGRYYGNYPDDTAPWKSLLDALVKSGLLVDDSRRWCEIEFPPVWLNGAKGTRIVLEDVET